MFARQDRTLTVVFAGLALLAVTMLALGIAELELESGHARALEAGGRGPGIGPIGELQLPATLMKLVGSALRIGVLILLPFAIIHFIRSPAARRQVLRQLAYLLLFSLAVLSLSESFDPLRLNQPRLSLPQPVLPSAAPDLVAELSRPPTWLISLTSMLAAALLVFLAYQLFQRTRKRAEPGGRLAMEARQALIDIHAGQRLESVILRAYYQLCEASWRHRGLRRAHHQTPREYGDDLQAAGIPVSALDRLTHLFEKVRYGNAALGEADERQAISALRAVLRSLGDL